LMHPGSWSSKTAITMNDWLYSYLNEENKNSEEKIITQGSMFKPSFCYRLDKDTSWVLIAAKKYDALQYLNQQIKDRKVTKRYIVVTQGKLPKKIEINKPLFKWFHAEKGRAHMFVNYEKWLASETHIHHILDTKIDKIWIVSLGLVRILTWRMHQIRVHAASEGFPVLWDKDYWNESVTRIAHKDFWVTRQLLHSYSYSFTDQHSKKTKTFIAPLPEDIKKLFSISDENHIQDKIKQFI
jgi:23S rRNA pseudouridine955/2504/2580 synthase